MNDALTRVRALVDGWSHDFAEDDEVTMGAVVADLRAALDTPPIDGLTDMQQQIVTVIRDTIDTRGYPPTIREIGDTVGLASTSSVAHQLQLLERKGVIHRDPNRPRALTIHTPAGRP